MSDLTPQESTARFELRPDGSYEYRRRERAAPVLVVAGLLQLGGGALLEFGGSLLARGAGVALLALGSFLFGAHAIAASAEAELQGLLTVPSRLVVRPLQDGGYRAAPDPRAVQLGSRAWPREAFQRVEVGRTEDNQYAVYLVAAEEVLVLASGLSSLEEAQRAAEEAARLVGVERSTVLREDHTRWAAETWAPAVLVVVPLGVWIGGMVLAFCAAGGEPFCSSLLLALGMAAVPEGWGALVRRWTRRALWPSASKYARERFGITPRSP